jgi:cytochrome c peroxidase
MTRKSAVKVVVILFAVGLLPALAATGSAGPTATSFEFKLPLGIPAETWSYFVPKDNPMTVEKVELGRQLFFDPRLSDDGKISCATCHDPKFAFADGKSLAEGINGRQGVRNSPTILNSMFNAGQFWDGRAESLEAQAKMPLLNPDEMGNESHQAVVDRLAKVPRYVTQFREVFGGPVAIDNLARAIAAYERTLVAGNSPADRYQAGDLNALSDAARNGMFLFRGKARCSICHIVNTNFPFLTDQNYRNTGVGANYKGFNQLIKRALDTARDETRAGVDKLAKAEGASELGRFVVTGNTLDIGAFRTPSLRNVELTAPYFHDGSAPTLADVVKFYVKGGNDNAIRDWQLEPVPLTEEEQRNLIEFLKALTSDDARQMVENERKKLSH